MASARQKVATTIASDGTLTVDPHDPVRVERFLATDDAQTRADQLTRVQSTLVEAATATRANGANQRRRFSDVKVTGGGFQLFLRHALGRRAFWKVTDWTPTVDGTAHNITRSSVDAAQQTNDLLVLRSYAAGTITVEVF